MTGRADLTRWNRAGLRRIRYVDANAAIYLEELRVRLAERFPVWEAIQRADVAGESAAQRDARMLEQYLAPRGEVPDWGWELARALARACHVLGEHVDAFANESYLATATQWESLRRLVALVDYHPAPPASAFTNLVLIAKPGASGTVPPGFAVSASTPGARVTFETMEVLSIDSALNLLRPADFDRNPEVLTGDSFALEGPLDRLAIGEPVVFERETDGTSSAHRIENVVVGAGTTSVVVSPPLAPGFVRGSTIVHLKPKDRLAALAPVKPSAVLGKDVQLVRGSAGILVGDVITIADHTHRSYHKVTAVVDPRITLDPEVGPLRFDSATIDPTVSVEVLESRPPPANTFTVVLAGDWRSLAHQVVADPRAFGDASLPLRYTVSAADYKEVTEDSADAGKTVLRLDANLDGPIPPGGSAPTSVLIAAPGTSAWTIDPPLAIMGSDPIVTAIPKATVGGDFVVAMMGSQLAWSRLASLTRDDPAAQASLFPVDSWQATPGEFLLAATTVFGHFTTRVRLDGWQLNPLPISGVDIPLALPGSGGRILAPDALVPGRKLVVYRLEAPDRAFLTVVAAVTGATLRLRDAIPADAGFTRSNLHIAGNVALASHGEHKPEKVLGSGDATASGQSFALAQTGVSFVPDPTQPLGVRADLDVVVDGRIWQQVGALREHGPTEYVYVVRIMEDGTLVLEFGDGQHGRRLPTGANNVRVRLRVGVGLAGNAPSGTLTRIARPHPLVAAVQQPLPAVGGNDMESADALRRTAPTTLLAMQRCVSPSDFASLAADHASIWQAAAFVRPSIGTRAHRVEVVVVPANGAELGELAQTIAAFLAGHALPNVEVTVRRFLPLPVTLAVTVEIDLAAFDPVAVLGDVRAALFDALSLRRRRLGQPVFLSDVYAVVENVTGVSTSRCVLDDDPTANRILSVSDGVLFLDPASPSTLSLSYEAQP
ncbi:MAG TPA: hypothetical protein VF469_33010 [Kofleriaceae bacterium]